jgi:GT2 family glycosyltransferase
MLDDVTILVVPRERFGMAEISLSSVIECTPGLKNLVYVDCASPAIIRERLETICAEQAFTLVRVDDLTHPNQLRNIGLTHVKTEFVLCMDNDVVVSAGWLDALMRCARQTGAAIVGPLYLEGYPSDPKIHMAGGDLRLVASGSRASIHNRMHHLDQRLFHTKPGWTRGKSGSAEFHCMLIRRSYLDALGGFDPELRTSREHLDLCLSVGQLGGDVYFEPESIVCFNPEGFLGIQDIKYYFFRWNELDTVRTLRHFERKWNVALERHHLHSVRKRNIQMARRIFRDRLLGLFKNRPSQAVDYSLQQAVSYIRGRSTPTSAGG